MLQTAVETGHAGGIVVIEVFTTGEARGGIGVAVDGARVNRSVCGGELTVADFDVIEVRGTEPLPAADGTRNFIGMGIVDLARTLSPRREAILEAGRAV